MKKVILMTRISFCPECEAEIAPETRREKKEVPIRGEVIAVEGFVNVCPLCGAELLDEAYDDLLEKAAAEYRRRHGLLNPDEIVRIRKSWGFNQDLFARLLGIGVASLRRYEKGAVQPPGYDALLRSAVNPQFLLEMAERNGDRLTPVEKEATRRKLEAFPHGSQGPGDCREALFSRYAPLEPQEMNGYRGLSLEKTKAVVAKVLSIIRENVNITKMTKLLFYIDFAHFRERQQSITGLPWYRWAFGPAPARMYDMYEYLRDEGVIEIEEQEQDDGESIRRTFILADDSPIMFLDEDENRIIEEVVSRLGRLSARRLSELSHEEAAYKNAEDKRLINYHDAEHLKAV
jgi:putative zinc finger/helix-turn-helix YgiT family protein